jgi:hypothetical protein
MKLNREDIKGLPDHSRFLEVEVTRAPIYGLADDQGIGFEESWLPRGCFESAEYQPHLDRGGSRWVVLLCEVPNYVQHTEQV